MSVNVLWNPPTSNVGVPVIATHQPGRAFLRGTHLVTYTFGSGMDLTVCAFLVEVRDGKYQDFKKKDHSKCHRADWYVSIRCSMTKHIRRGNMNCIHHLLQNKVNKKYEISEARADWQIDRGKMKKENQNCDERLIEPRAYDI